MPLTPQEQARLAELEAKFSPKPSGGLTPQEQARLAELDAKFGSRMQPVEEKPGFYSAGETAKRAATGALQTIPFAGALMNKAQGQDAYQGAKIQRGASMLGDVSNAALTGLTLGKGLGLGAGLNALLEGSGAGEGIRKTQAGIEQAYEPKTRSVAANMALNLPAYVASYGIGIIPALLAGKAKLPARKAAPVDPAVALRAEFAAKEGIPLTKGETLGGTSSAAVKEAGFRRTPGGEKAALDMQSAQQAAVREALAKRTMGDDVLAGEIRQGGPMTEGRQLADVPEAAKALRQERGQAVGAAKKALAQEIPIRSNFAKELQAEIDSTLSKVAGAGKGSNRAKVADLLESYKEQAKSVKTMAGAINFLDDFDSAIKGTFDREAPNVQKVYLKGVRDKIVGALDQAGEKLAPEAQAQLKTAKAGFAEIADPAQALKGLEETNPAALLRSISGGQKSLAKVQDFNKVFKPGSQQRQGIKSALVQDVIKKGMQKDGISGAAMAKALDKMDQATLKEIFSDKPKELAEFRSFVKGLEDIEAQRTPLGIQPKGNSHTAPLMKAIGAVAGAKIPGAGWAMEKLAEYRSGRAFKPYKLEAPKAKKPNVVDTVRARYGFDPALLGRQLQASAQGQ
jgi:hypothetical protein